MDKWKRITESQLDWELDRPRMTENNRDLLRLYGLLFDELIEAGEEVQEIEWHRENTGSVPLKIVEALAAELADVFMFVQQMFSIIGVDMFAAIMDKKGQNHAKHTADKYNNGIAYSEGRRRAKYDWDTRNLYDDYYEVGLDGKPYEQGGVQRVVSLPN